MDKYVVMFSCDGTIEVEAESQDDAENKVLQMSVHELNMFLDDVSTATAIQEDADEV